MTSDRIWTAGLVVIGDEILSGRTQDRNVAQVGTWLNLQGIRLAEVRVVADDMDAIAEAVTALRARNDYLFTTGGIGPTHDDITVDAIAAALRVPVVVHPKARAVLEAYFATRGGVTEARLRIARVPEGAELIETRMSATSLSGAQQPIVRESNGRPPSSCPDRASSIRVAMCGTPARMKTLPSRMPGAPDILFSISSAPSGTRAMRSRASVTPPRVA